MDAASILVLILTAGVVALLAWFEINSRRNDARMESKSALDQSGIEGLKKTIQVDKRTETQEKKAA